MKLNFQLSTCNSQLHRRCNGISIIELIVILSIIIILVAVGIVEYSRFDNRARREGSLVAAKAIGTALKLYYHDKIENYTSSIVDLLPYTDITKLYSSISPVAINTTGGRSIRGVVRGISPTYLVNYTVDCEGDAGCITGANKRTNIRTQPTCCNTEGGLDCNNDANWFPCVDKM